MLTLGQQIKLAAAVPGLYRMFVAGQGLSGVREKEASTAKLLRAVASFNKKGLPIPQHIKNELLKKTTSSVSRLYHNTFKNAPVEDVSNKLRQIGVKDPRAYAQRVKKDYGLFASGRKSMSHIHNAQNALKRYGNDFTKIRANIPKDRWASDAEIEAFKRYARQLRKERGLNPDNYPLNIHRRLFKEYNALGTTATTDPITKQRGFVDRSVNPGGVNIFLSPTDNKSLSSFRKALLKDNPNGGTIGIADFQNQNIKNRYLRRTINNNTLWHEGGHLLDPRAIAANSPGDKSSELFGTLFGNQSMFRRAGNQQNKFLQDYAKAQYYNYPQQHHGAPPLPLNFMHSDTKELFDTAITLHNALLPGKAFN